MGVIALSFNKKLVNVYRDDRNVLVHDKETNSLIFTLPIPKGFSFLGQNDTYYGDDHSIFIFAPYCLEYPKYLPNGYENVQLLPCGLYSATKINENKEIIYIDTSFLKSEDYDYVSQGKFKITEKEIPASFWVSAPGFGKGCKANQIEEKVKEFDVNARLIYEEELMSIFSLQDYKTSFLEHISEQTYFSMRQIPKFVVQIGSYSLDNLINVACSRENRKVYREITHYWNFSYSHWYDNTAFIESDKEENILNPIYVYSVLENQKKAKNLYLKK